MGGIKQWREMADVMEAERDEALDRIAALKLEQAAIKKVLDDAGQMDVWPPYEGPEIAGRVRAVVVCRDMNSDEADMQERARKELKAELAERDAAIVWLTDNFRTIRKDAGERGGYMVRGFPAADTAVDALLAAFRQHKATKEGDDAQTTDD